VLNLFKESVSEQAVNAYSFVLAGIARLAISCETLDEAVMQRLQEMTISRIEGRQNFLEAFNQYMQKPAACDAPLAEAMRHFHLTPVEVLAVRLAVAAEQDLLIGHVLSHLQQPLASGRPTVGLTAQAYAPDELPVAVHQLAQGNAVRCGLLQLIGEDSPLPERQMRVPLPTALALQQMESSWPGATPITVDRFSVPLCESSTARALSLAKRMREASSPGPALIIRSGDSLEARAAAALVCSGYSARAVLVSAEHIAGIAPWLKLNAAIPVFSNWLAPGERRSIPAILGHRGPIIVLTGPEGEFESDNRAILDWRLETPSVAERSALWQRALGDAALATRLAREHRHAAGRIASLAAKACDEAGEKTVVSYAHIRSVSRRGDSAGLGALAELIPDEVDDDALILTASLRHELEALVTRCRMREHFSKSLGPSIQARYRPSVRALFVGPSGTGKTLAVAWLATRLGIPLFRVDLSTITSKYIGETEKNLSQLLARAEQNEVLLLFDEADALFGKRTDIHDANDRFANAQTNYLLQRMESYDGITVLTSNGRSRFDDAFARRFDAILSFPLPGPEERRALWSSHLGTAHNVNSEQLNRLSAIAELSGGQIRNAVLRSAVAAAQDGKQIVYRHLLTGVTSEYRKLSRQLPSELKQAEALVSA
jgi:ATPase family associated with various cellular activities (AAA)